VRSDYRANITAAGHAVPNSKWFCDGNTSRLRGSSEATVGTSAKHGLTIVNAPGTIDSDYRGEVAIVLINHGQEPYEIRPFTRIAQLVISRVERSSIELVDELDDTLRGQGGYGSTGE